MNHPPSALDRLTLVAIAAVAYVLANGVHEGVGHGGARLLMGGRPVALSAVFFECDRSGLPASTHRWIAAAGTLANLAVGDWRWPSWRGPAAEIRLRAISSGC
jgi:hypothetical protein